MTSIVNLECKPASLKEVTHTRKEIEKILGNRSITTHLSNKILLCFAEAASNLVNHACPRPTFIQVNIEYNDGCWQLHLNDDGQRWNPTLPDRVRSLDFFNQNEGGRGLALIHSLSDDMEYKIQKESRFHRLSLKWYLKETTTKPCILIVDDDLCQLRLYSAYLSEEYHVIEAENGETALCILLQKDVDLVISDIRMPHMDGLSLKKALHKHSYMLLIPFIFLTDDDNSETRNNALSLGIDDYMIKPVSKFTLLQTSRRILKRSNQIHNQLTNRVNKRISDSLMPSLPRKAHGWEMTVISRNTGIGGGDLVLHHDYSTHINSYNNNQDRNNSDNYIMLNIVDVMGHDVTAKFFSYAFVGYLRGLMYHIDSNKKDPCPTLLRQLSDSALEDGLLSQVILTCCSITLSAGGKFEIATAGHPAPFKISPSGIQKLDVGGILPGVVSGATYKSLTSYLDYNERLVLYTDGLFEAAENKKARKQLETHVTNTLYNTLSIPLNEAAESVMHIFDHYSNNNRDDATLVLLQPETTK
ncbi:SpoIIE family protein phosphatase [Candidatus Enterovibrio escicola]|uniref:SpoIIE family protein phosphatase n=1 Tax=Candidatus Enterovibrio escicola TaxID=1927127 RepID=UPI001237CCFF|nr:SpoIIE family protein phosphatase [Candidatus Enterovibrio escacola]